MSMPLTRIDYVNIDKYVSEGNLISEVVQCRAVQYSTVSTVQHRIAQHSSEIIGQYNIPVRLHKGYQIQTMHNMLQPNTTQLRNAVYLFCSPGIVIASAEWILIINNCTEFEVITAVKSGL